VEPVQSYLVEAYLARATPAELEDMANRARLVTGAMRAEGHTIRYVRSTFLPEDETCFHLFQGASEAIVGEAARRGLAVDRRDPGTA